MAPLGRELKFGSTAEALQGFSTAVLIYIKCDAKHRRGTGRMGACRKNAAAKAFCAAAFYGFFLMPAVALVFVREQCGILSVFETAQRQQSHHHRAQDRLDAAHQPAAPSRPPSSQVGAYGSAMK
ncbi:hypothetical protein [Azospirillum canadense]|uniref:hypothetical protein n=1 Tax=Azospirillum canadense TaxID=403962 RepID=UPI0022267064|nr:hypothetical protein [Azospirillum canadense]MCW2243240.1 hypothetical protein [Azospirillum canadense]